MLPIARCGAQPGTDDCPSIILKKEHVTITALLLRILCLEAAASGWHLCRPAKGDEMQ